MRRAAKMTNQDIVIAIAKLDGFTLNASVGQEAYPPYLTSRDAIIPVIEKHVNTKDEVWNFSVNLSKILTEADEDYLELSPVDYITATARQLSIALLKATGNWMEE